MFERDRIVREISAIARALASLVLGKRSGIQAMVERAQGDVSRWLDSMDDGTIDALDLGELVAAAGLHDSAEARAELAAALVATPGVDAGQRARRKRLARRLRGG